MCADADDARALDLVLPRTLGDGPLMSMMLCLLLDGWRAWRAHVDDALEGNGG